MRSNFSVWYRTIFFNGHVNGEKYLEMLRELKIELADT